MRTLYFLTLFIYGSLVYSQDIGGDYYVAPWGDDFAAGSYDAPWGTFQKAFKEARPGDTVYFRGGVYMSTERNTIDPDAWPKGIGVSGTRENPIHYFGYPGEWPILDCILHCDYARNGGDNFYNSAISLNAVEYIHFKDFEIRNVFQCDSVVTGGIGASAVANLIFEHIIMHNIGQRGYWINGGAWGEYTQDPAPQFDHDTTRWINCDVYDLCDTLATSPGNAADAWKTIHYKGNVIIWDGCRAWNYTDDGYDPTPVDGAKRVFKNTWAMAGNKYANVSEDWDTERNGFKLNSAHPKGDLFNVNSIIMSNCLALFCNHGIYEIGGTPPNGLYYNNTSYKNGIGFAGQSISNSIYRNNVVYGSSSISAIKEPFEVSMWGEGIAESHNTWDRKSGYPTFVITDTVSVTDEDFITLDSATLVALFTAPRKQDGSLPSFPLKLAAGSDLIDAGVDVGLSFNGIAPDIGAYEYGTEEVPSGNQFPSVSIVSPKDGSVFIDKEEITIISDPADSDGSISKVEFFSGNSKIGETSTAPWSLNWKSPPLGKHFLRVVATDNEEAKTTSSQVIISVSKAVDSLEISTLLSPNPNNGVFTLLLPEPLQSSGNINVISLEGKVVYADTMNEKEIVKEFDLSSIRPGFYMLAFSNTENYYWSKFVKL